MAENAPYANGYGGDPWFWTYNVGPVEARNHSKYWLECPTKERSFATVAWCGKSSRVGSYLGRRLLGVWAQNLRKFKFTASWK